MPAEVASNGFTGQESEVFAGGITGVTTGTEAADPAVFLDETAVLAQQTIHHQREGIKQRTLQLRRKYNLQPLLTS
ncbi:MAG: hypothetical protein K8I82_26655 [Anaerolineae bacterium]|nr:hypothetical protein [Anaerolineae bacterium]